MTKTQLGWLLALASVFAYSTNTPLARAVIVAGINPTTLLAYRFTLGAILFGGTITFTSLGTAKGEQRPLDQRGLIFALLIGVANGLTLLCFYWALSRLNASIASPLGIALIPIFTLAILRLGGEAFTRKQFLRLILSLIGIYLLMGFSGAIDLWGVTLVALGAFLYASHMVAVQWYLPNYNTWMVSALMAFAAAAVMLTFWLVNVRDFFVPGLFGWVAILILGIVASYLGRVMTYAAVAYIGSAQLALVTPVETVLTIFWSVLFLNETLLPIQWIGAILIVLSLLLAAEWRQRKTAAVT